MTWRGWMCSAGFAHPLHHLFMRLHIIFTLPCHPMELRWHFWCVCLCINDYMRFQRYEYRALCAVCMCHWIVRIVFYLNQLKYMLIWCEISRHWLCVFTWEIVANGSDFVCQNPKWTHTCYIYIYISCERYLMIHFPSIVWDTRPSTHAWMRHSTHWPKKPPDAMRLKVAATFWLEMIPSTAIQ